MLFPTLAIDFMFAILNATSDIMLISISLVLWQRTWSLVLFFVESSLSIHSIEGWLSEYTESKISTTNQGRRIVENTPSGRKLPQIPKQSHDYPKQSLQRGRETISTQGGQGSVISLFLIDFWCLS